MYKGKRYRNDVLSRIMRGIRLGLTQREIAKRLHRCHGVIAYYIKHHLSQYFNKCPECGFLVYKDTHCIRHKKCPYKSLKNLKHRYEEFGEEPTVRSLKNLGVNETSAWNTIKRFKEWQIKKGYNLRKRYLESMLV